MKLIHSNIIGQGNINLLILHGFLGMGDNWKSFASKFSKLGFKVHLLDQRNHGRSFWDKKFNYKILAEDIYNYINYHKIINPLVLGHSMGGKTAMTVACNFPGIIKKIIIADIVPKKYNSSHQEILKGLSSLDFEKLKNRNSIDFELSKFVHERPIRQFLLKNLYWRSKEKFALRLNIDVLKNQFEKISELPNLSLQFKGQSLFLFGENSQYYNSDDDIIIRNIFPNAKIVLIGKASHWIHVENPDDFSKEILDWI